GVLVRGRWDRRGQTEVLTDRLLFALLLSLTEEDTLAVFAIVEPCTAEELTRTTRVKLALAPTAREASRVHDTTSRVGPSQNQPGAGTRTNVVPDGMASVIVGVASLGPV